LFAKLKRAFTWHWNLLAVGAGVAFAFMSGQPDVVLPAIAAGEIAYLGFVGINPRFQKVLQGKEMLEDAAQQQAARSAAAQRKLRTTLDALPKAEASRFENLRARCIKLTKLRSRLGHGDAGETQFRSESLEKLLWLFLGVQNQRAAIDSFLATTDRDELATDLDAARADVEAALVGNRGEQLLRSLKERVETIESRIENYDQAQDNRDLLTAELDKTEQKIAHICEVGMTNKSPADLGTQIDSIAESVTLSQQALSGINLGSTLSEEPLADGTLLSAATTYGGDEVFASE
jgi:hypothetical protein